VNEEVRDAFLNLQILRVSVWEQTEMCRVLLEGGRRSRASPLPLRSDHCGGSEAARRLSLQSSGTAVRHCISVLQSSGTAVVAEKFSRTVAIMHSSCTSDTSTLETYYSDFIARPLCTQNCLKYVKIQY